MGFTIDFSVLNQKGTPALYSDIFANRPAAGYQGRLFIATDTAAIYEDTGTAWTLIANVSSGAGTLQQVTTNGNTSNVGISVTAGGVSTNSLTDTSLTTGSVPFAGAGGLISQDNANLFWDDTNNRLGINTNTPGNSLDVHTTSTNPTIAVNNTAGNQSAISFLKTSIAKWRIGNTATDTFDIFNFILGINALSISSTNNQVSFLGSIKIQNGAGFSGTAGYGSLGSLSTGFIFQNGTSLNTMFFDFGGFTAGRSFIFPNADGTIALTSNLSAYLPLAGGTLTGGLGGTSATFSGNVAMNSGLAAISAIPSTAQAMLRFDGNDSRSSYFGKENASGNYSWSSGGTAFATVICAYNQTTPIQFGHNSPEMSLFSTGNLAINSTVDDTVNKLQVTGNAKINGNIGANITPYATYGLSAKATNGIWIERGSTNDSGVQISHNGTNAIIAASYQSTGSYGGIQFFVSSASALNISSAGVVQIVNLNGTGSRAVIADSTGVLTAPVSDQSVKQNIEPLKYGLETIMKLNAVQFEFIEKYKNYGEGLQIGAIAQEVEQIIPEAVFKTPSTGLKGIDYNQFNGIYIKAIQDQQKIIESLIQRIEALENK